MALPASGALSLSDLQSEFGGSNPISLGEYYKGSSLVPATLSYLNYSTGISGAYVPASVPSTGTIRLGGFYRSDLAKVYTGLYSGADTTPVKTSFAIGSVSVSFDPATYIGSLSSGDTFLICCANTTGWPYGWYYSDYDTVILSCTYGSSSSISTPQVAGKQWKPSATYDGANSATIGGAYSGGSTDFPFGQNFLQGIVRTS